MRSKFPLLIIAWALAVTVMRTLRMPSDFAEGHWLLGYQFGFMKRGLVGAVCNTALSAMGLKMTPTIIAALSAIVFACLMAGILTISYRMLRATPFRDQALMMVIVFASSPFIVLSAHFFGYFDHLVYLFTMVAVALMLSDRPLAAAAVSSMAMLVHEGFLLMGFPLVCLASLAFHLKHGRRIPRLAMVAAWSIPPLVFIGIPIVQNLASDRMVLKQQLYDYLTSTGFLVERISSCISGCHVLSFMESMGQRQLLSQIPILESATLASLVPAFLAILYYIHAAFGIRPLSLLSLLILTTVTAPLAMHIVAWDASRISSFVLGGAFIAAWIMAETRQARQPDKLFVLTVLPAFALNVIGRIPLMDQQVERIPNVVLLALLAPALFLLVWPAIKDCRSVFSADFSGGWLPNSNIETVTCDVESVDLAGGSSLQPSSHGKLSGSVQL